MHHKPLLLSLFLGIGLVPVVSAAQGVSLTSGFTDFTTWNLYGSATASNFTPGNGFSYSELRLTYPGVAGSAGAGFAPDSLTLDFNQAFSFDFNFFIPAGTVLRGDGMTFTLTDTPGFGGAGSGLGYEGFAGASVAFAIDTFHFDGEPVSPSLQILQGGSTTPLAYMETGLGDDVRDSAWQWRATVDFTPSGNDDEMGTLTGSITRPDFGTFSVSANVDLSGLGHTVYYGFTASNGLADDGHFVTSAVPVPEPETWAMLLAGLGLVGVSARRTRHDILK